jgi:hypothetical protein
MLSSVINWMSRLPLRRSKKTGKYQLASIQEAVQEAPIHTASQQKGSRKRPSVEENVSRGQTVFYEAQ